MDPDAFDERYARAAAAAIGVAIPAGHDAAVAENLRRIAVLAAPMLALELGDEEEIAPMWRP